MLDEHTQVDLPPKITKQTMTERSSMPQREEHDTINELFRVFKELVKRSDKQKLLEQMTMLAEGAQPDKPSTNCKKTAAHHPFEEAKTLSSHPAHHDVGNKPKKGKHLSKRPPQTK